MRLRVRFIDGIGLAFFVDNKRFIVKDGFFMFDGVTDKGGTQIVLRCDQVVYFYFSEDTDQKDEQQTASIRKGK